MNTIHATFHSVFFWITALTLGLLVALPAVADSAKAMPANNDQPTQVAQAQQAPAQRQAQAQTVTIINVTAAQAARAARHEYGGKVLGVRLEQSDNKGPFYRVRLISRGRVHVVSVNAHK